MRTLTRTLALLLMLLTLCTLCLTPATAETDSNVDEDIPYRYEYINSAHCDVGISNGTASIISSVRGTPGLTTKCEIEVKLQRKLVFWWAPVATWNQTAYSYQATLNPTHAVESGGSYRAVAVFTVWNGSSSESTTVTSSVVVAP